MGKPKLQSLSALIGEQSAETSIASDSQSRQLSDLGKETQASRALLLEEVLFDLSNDERTRLIEVLLNRRTEIVDHWRKAGKHFLGAGRALLALQREIPGASMERLLDSYDRNERDGIIRESALPFGRVTANRLVAVAKMVETRRFHVAFESAGMEFDESQLPPYSISCSYASLDDDQLVTAVRQNLIHPTIPRKQVIDFVSALRQPERSANGINAQRQLAKITSRINKHYGEIVELERQRKVLLRQMGVAQIEPGSPVIRDNPATGSMPLTIVIPSYSSGREPAEAVDHLPEDLQQTIDHIDD